MNERGYGHAQALGDEGRMLVYGSLTGDPIQVGADPRYILAGRRVPEVFWLGYWFGRLHETAQQNLVREIVSLMRDGMLLTSAGRRFALDDIGSAVTEAESTAGRGRRSWCLKRDDTFSRAR